MLDKLYEWMSYLCRRISHWILKINSFKNRLMRVVALSRIHTSNCVYYIQWLKWNIMTMKLKWTKANIPFNSQMNVVQNIRSSLYLGWCVIVVVVVGCCQYDRLGTMLFHCVHLIRWMAKGVHAKCVSSP